MNEGHSALLTLELLRESAKAGEDIEGVTGWPIGGRCDMGANVANRADCDADSLYDKLEHVVMPLFYQQRERYVDVMRHAIALNGSFFNTHSILRAPLRLENTLEIGVGKVIL